MYYVYAISSLERNYIYVGLTNNIERRFSEHNTGRNKTTKPYSPFVIIYVEECSNRIEARIKEKYFKSGIGKEKLRIIRDNYLE
jgi:putative endonuclease